MWWTYIVVPALLALGIYGFVLIVRVQTRRLTGKTDRRAEDLYDEFADPRGGRHRQP
jgi:hypothetical protein